MRVSEFSSVASPARISDLQTIGPSDYRTLGQPNLRTIEQPPNVALSQTRGFRDTYTAGAAGYTELP